MLILACATTEKRDKSMARELSVTECIRLVTGLFEKYEGMESTGAGLKALKFVNEVTEGTNKTIKNSLNGRTISFRRI